MEKERTKMETRLSELRRAKGLSQSQLADTIHVCRQSVSDWERGASRPTRENLVLLSELYGVSVDYLLEREPQTPPEEVTQPQTEEAEPLAPETEEAEPPTEPEGTETSPESKPGKAIGYRLWFYRCVTLVLAVLLVVMVLLFVQAIKNDRILPMEKMATDIVVPMEEFD